MVFGRSDRVRLYPVYFGASMTCCRECDFWDKEKHQYEMDEWIKILAKTPKHEYDFGWNLVHVPEPKDEERINR